MPNYFTPWAGQNGACRARDMVKHGKPGIMLDRIFSEHKLRGSDSSRFPGGDGYYVRTTDGKRIGAHATADAARPCCVSRPRQRARHCARDCAGPMTEREFNIVRTTNDVLRVASAWRAEPTRTPRRLRWVRTGYACQPPALGTYRRRRAACPHGSAYCTCWIRVLTSHGRTVRTAHRGTPGGVRLAFPGYHPRWRESGGAVFKVQLKSQV